jgi:hypothetical protein
MSCPAKMKPSTSKSEEDGVTVVKSARRGRKVAEEVSEPTPAAAKPRKGRAAKVAVPIASEVDAEDVETLDEETPALPAVSKTRKARVPRSRAQSEEQDEVVPKKVAGRKPRAKKDDGHATDKAPSGKRGQLAPSVDVEQDMEQDTGPLDSIDQDESAEIVVAPVKRGSKSRSRTTTAEVVFKEEGVEEPPAKTKRNPATSKTTKPGAASASRTSRSTKRTSARAATPEVLDKENTAEPQSGDEQGEEEKNKHAESGKEKAVKSGTRSKKVTAQPENVQVAARTRTRTRTATGGKD